MYVTVIAYCPMYFYVNLQKLGMVKQASFSHFYKFIP